MSIAETVRGELQTGLKMLAFKSVKTELAPLAMACVDGVMAAAGWEAISDVTKKGGADGSSELGRYYYSSMQKGYAHAVCSGTAGICEIRSADETEMLESMTFPELQHLGKLIDKKSVAFIRIFSEKELASAQTEEELKALNERNEKMIAEAEVALRKR